MEPENVGRERNLMTMRKTFPVLAAALLGLGMQQAQASLAAYWTFPTGYNDGVRE